MGFQYGSAVFPLDATRVPTLLPVCDPALAKILDFVRFGILKYAGDAVTANLDVPDTSQQDRPSLASAIAQVAPIDPDTIARAEQFQFPLLCGWTKSVKYNQKTLNWVCDVRKCGLAYILPPLTASQAVRWIPLLNSISQLVNALLSAGHDVDYNSDERVLLANQITSAKLDSADFGHYDFAGKSTPPYFAAWVAELEIEQKQAAYAVGLSSFAGADVTVTHQQRDDVSTVIAANAAIAATSIQVASSAGFNALDVIIIGEDTAREESISVVAIPDATHLTLASVGLAFAHTAVQADTVKRKPVTIIQAKTDVG